MLEICFASHNPGKLARYSALVSPLGVSLRSLPELGITQKADEPFSTSMENARHKARFYTQLVDMPVLAVDEELSTNFLPEHLQPGVLVRRLGQDLAHDPSDEEVLAHWLQLVKQHPHPHPELDWVFSIVYLDQESGASGSATVVQKNEVAQRTAAGIEPGYPMSSFMSPAGTGGLPYSETPPELVARAEQENFAPFVRAFKRWLQEVRRSRADS